MSVVSPKQAKFASELAHVVRGLSSGHGVLSWKGQDGPFRVVWNLDGIFVEFPEAKPEGQKEKEESP